jgi:hypothetical protein
MNIINVGENIFECHDVISNDVKFPIISQKHKMVNNNMYLKVILEQCKISNQDF